MSNDSRLLLEIVVNGIAFAFIISVLLALWEILMSDDSGLLLKLAVAFIIIIVLLKKNK